jgi:hypothetical protein
MKSIAPQLSGGDRRSTGNSDKVVAHVLKHPEKFAELMDAIQADDPIVRMRAADAAEKISAARPDLLQPHKSVLLNDIGANPQQEVRWHLAEMVPRLKLTAGERRSAYALLYSFLNDKSGIVRTFSMQAMYDLSLQDASLQPDTREMLERMTATGTPAMKSRGKKLLAQLKKE